jgi:TonB family protein
VRIMTPTVAEKLSPIGRLLLVSVGIAAVAGPVLFGLWKTPPVSAQSPMAKSAAQDAPRIYHVGAGVSAPKLIFAPDPEYSEEAKREKYQGACVIATVVDAEGNPQRIRVVRHLGKGLDQKAVEAVEQYKFEPAMLHGKPVAVQVNIEVNFRLY